MRALFSLALRTALLIGIGLARVASAQVIPAGAIVALTEGKRLLKEKRTDDAITRLSQAVELAPDYGEAWTELGNAHLEKQSYDQAARAFDKALEKKPDQTVARYNLAFSLRKLGKHREAAEQYRLYLQRQPNDADAHYGLAEALRAAGDKAAAAEAYEAYASTEKNPAQAKWVEKARETAAQLRSEAPDPPPAPAPKPAVTKPAATKVAAAVTPPKEAKESKPAKPADAESLHLDFSAAALTQAPAVVEEKAPVSSEARPAAPRPASFRAGLTDLQNGDYQGALARLVEADRERPNDAMILAALAGAHLGLEHGEEAEAIYERAIATAVDGAQPGIYLGLGEARRLLGKDRLAVDAYQQALAHQRATASIKRFSQERIAALK